MTGCTMRVPQLKEVTVVKLQGRVCAKVVRLAIVAGLTLVFGVGVFGQTKAEAKATPKRGPVDPGMRGGSAGVGWPL